jgi:cell division protein FtsB
MPATVAATPPQPRAAIPPRVRRLLWTALFGVTVLAVFVIGVFPTRQYLDQRATTNERSAELSQLRAENAKLQAQIDALATDAEIERIARSEYSLVYPGEETYAVLPPPTTATGVPSVWPFGD